MVKSNSNMKTGFLKRFTFLSLLGVVGVLLQSCDSSSSKKEIFIEKGSTLIPLWVANQSSIIEIPEYSKKLAFLECELTNKRVAFEFKKNNNKHLNYVASSICRWETDYMPFLLYDGDRQFIINNGDFNNLTERNIKED